METSKNSLAGNQLTLLVEELNKPALIIDFAHNLILSLNKEARRFFNFESHKPIRVEFETAKGFNPSKIYYFISQDGNKIVLYERKKSDAGFKLFLISAEFGIFTRLPDRRSIQNQKKTSLRSITYEGVDHSEFSLCYLHDLMQNKRIFSDINRLIEMSIISPEDNLKFFDWRSIILKQDLASYDEILDSCIKNGGHYKISYRIKKLYGGSVQVDDYLGAIKLDDKWPVISGCIVKKDFSISEIKQIEQQSLTVKLVEGMIHDFKNLLAGIQNIVEWCVTRPEAPGNITNALSKTISYTNQAASLLTNVLRLIGGKRNNTLIEEINLGDLLLELDDLINHIISPHITFSLIIEPSLPPILGVRSILQDMILNLCINARDAMVAQGSKVTIQCYKIDGKGTSNKDNETDEYVVVRVKDDGCGLSEDQIKSIFNAYFSTKEKGTGLGLWMVNESVKTLGGKITVESKKNHGTTFEIQLKTLSQSGNQEKSSNSKPQSPLLKIKPFRFEQIKTVLLIEDEPLINSGITAWLKSFGFDVLSVDNGVDGRDIFMEHINKIDLIIQDFVLPGIRGDDLLDYFLSKKPKLPIIVISAFPGGMDSQWIINKGAFAFLPKPFKIESLARLIHDAFD